MKIVTVPRNCAFDKSAAKGELSEDSAVKADGNINSDEIVDDSFNPSV